MLDQCIDRKGNSKLDALQREYNFGKGKKNTNEFYLHAFEIQENSLLVQKIGDRSENAAANQHSASFLPHDGFIFYGDGKAKCLKL